MNFSKLIFIVIACIILMGCYTRDDDDNYPIIVEIEDALIFENSKNYVVGDTIFFALDFSRYLKEDGYSNLLDIYETTGNEEFIYAFDLRKFSTLSNRFDRVNVDTQFLIAEKGNVYWETNRAGAVLNQEFDLYESKVGLILGEPGEYKLDPNNYFISGEYLPDKVSVQISHSFTDNDPEKFTFSVAE